MAVTPSISSSYSKISVSCLLDQHGACANAQLKVRSQSEIWVDHSHWMLLRHLRAVIWFRHFSKRCGAYRIALVSDNLRKNTRGPLNAPWREHDLWYEQMNLNTEKDSWWAYRDLTVSFLFNNQPDTLIIRICSVIEFYMFQASSPPIIRSSSVPSGHQTCMKLTSAECTVENSWWWAEEMPETCRVL